MNTRIYAVNDGKTKRLVRAASATQAVKHTTKHISVELPDMEEFAKLLLAGVEIEDVEREPAPATGAV